jgi:two-component system, NtrC family, nitrogen regulation response regulator GlnG
VRERIVENQTEELGTDLSPEARAGCILYIAEGNEQDRGKSLKLEVGHAVVGSDDNCDLILFDTSVSRRHMRVTIHAKGVEISDLGSTNGVRYLDNRIQSITMEVGGRLYLGRTVLDVLPLPRSTLNSPFTDDRYGALVGISATARELFGQLKLLEKTDAPVLIQGETGTGKELIAQAMHDHSARHARPYVVIDCANLSKDLVGSELFGHVKGAFTGASSDRAGAFEEAAGGTVFLDEIGELPLELQTNLLRILEVGEIKRLGQSTYRKVDVRVLAATHRDLTQRVAEGRFREDLYFRLSVFTVDVPPLRERSEDLDFLIQTLQERMGLDATPLAAEAMSHFRRHLWPGNIRELRNALQRFHVLGDLPRPKKEKSAEQELSAEFSIDTTGEFTVEKERVLRVFESAYLKDVVGRTKNISDAARDAGISRKQMRELLKRHKLYE